MISNAREPSVTSAASRAAGAPTTHKLFSRGMAERRKRREKLDALDHVGLADRIGADEDGERA